MALIFAVPETDQVFLFSMRCWRTTLSPAAFGLTEPRILTMSSLAIAVVLLIFAVTE